ncbi:anthranilate synthase component II [Glycomyces algeriensis]|uniref:Glutamine amidotransferase n=1 Tax=Glycomyces algeriensis TaxID=256037 RepID=A0A9W6GAA7_9ACTN|nr:aminodeoxychorismate/anthranilate synthase component II [Glycomyces algeriensis]MDA1364379.1 aminodeoxychorismate/anthranilate synthase component II [Glycomyces algeriensis]MDR7350412.1 anthranilate synthase component 2 [Glycomyces algeriensis]GLI43119.1 glutamine amidotransferase [Glycomyces algeriensis]
MKALLIDAYDSFAHIIYQYLRVLDIDTDVIRSGDIAPAGALAHDADFVLLGPGPGTPEDSGHVEMVRALAGVKPVLGVCLGHQAVGVAFGAQVRPARHLMHGKTSTIDHDGRGVFTDAPQRFSATRYHSLIVVEDTLPAELEVTARAADDGYVMGVRHRELLIEGVQFHPESILTESGMGLFAGFAAAVRAQPAGARA